MSKHVHTCTLQRASPPHRQGKQASCMYTTMKLGGSDTCVPFLKHQKLLSESRFPAGWSVNLPSLGQGKGRGANKNNKGGQIYIRKCAPRVPKSIKVVVRCVSETLIGEHTLCGLVFVEGMGGKQKPCAAKRLRGATEGPCINIGSTKTGAPRTVCPAGTFRRCVAEHLRHRRGRWRPLRRAA